MITMERKMNFNLLHLLLIFYISFSPVHGIAVMSIDLGTEWMKVGIVSPGVPMEIALNHESQRKTPVTVAFRDSERHFGDPAMTIGVRYPDKAFIYILELLGKKVDNPIIKLFQKNFPYYNITSHGKRETVILNHPDGMAFTPEELIAMILKHAQEIAKIAAGQPIKDAVITVPPYFNQAERRSLLQAAEMADIKVLQLINSNTAVALNYGVFRRKDFNETPTNILFYDMGAGSTVATIASYQMVKSKDKSYSESNPLVNIKGVGFDRTLGGLGMQLKLRDYLAKNFNKQVKSADVFNNNRAMAKLFKEAGRVKKILSANIDHVAQVESLFNDIDFKLPVSRLEFEELCNDLFERVQNPVKMALESAGMIMGEIDQIILAGAATRTPKVQQKLLEIVEKSELGKSINADEAATLGAAYQAAYLSKGFKVKTFLIKDANVYPIQVDFQREVELEDGNSGTKFVKRTLFHRNNPFPQKKIMTFNRHMKDFSFNINYGEMNFLPQLEYEAVGSFNLSLVSLSGIQEALSKHEGENEPKGVKAHFHLDDSGILRIDHVESVFEKKIDDDDETQTNLESTLAKLGNTIGKLFSGESEKTNEKEESSEEKQKFERDEDSDSKEKKTSKKELKEEEGNTTKENSESAKNDTQGKTDKKGPKIITIKENIITENIQVDLPDMTLEQTMESQNKLKKLDNQDQEKLAKEKAKNALESYILETKEKMYTEEYERAATKKEIDNILSKLSEDGEWLEYESQEATTEVFKEKLSNLKLLTKELFKRVQEHKDRPEAIKALNDMINISNMFLTNALKVPKDDQIFTDVELTTLEKLINETKAWNDENVREQEKTPLTENPKLTLKSIAEKIAALDREVKYLLNKARFAVPKTKLNEPTDSETLRSNDSQETGNETQSTDNINNTKPEVKETIETANKKQNDDISQTDNVPIESETTEPSSETSRKSEPSAESSSETSDKSDHTEL